MDQSKLCLTWCPKPEAASIALHPQLLPRGLVEEGKESYVCRVCGRTFYIDRRLPR